MDRIVHISEKGMRLERFLRIHFPTLPPAARLIGQGRLTVDGRRIRAQDALQPGQCVRIAPPAARPASAAGEGASPAAPTPTVSDADRARLAAMTLHEDDDLLVFDKPAGLAVHAGTRTTDDLDRLLAGLVDAEGERPVLVHRLDKDTSGLLVAARRKAVAARLGAAFAGRDVAKTYVAEVEGVPEAAEGVIAAALKKVETPRGGRMVAADGDPEARPAETRWRRLAVRPDGASSLLALTPLTGRQHQLRAHCALIGHPIRGDRLYGRAGSAPRLMLHALAIEFDHPAGRHRRFETPWPEPFGPRPDGL